MAEKKQCNRDDSGLWNDSARANHIAEILKVLAHPIRIQIVAILCRGPEHVNALAEQLGVKQAIVSQQLRILRMGGLVDVARQSGRAYYSSAEPRLQDLIQCMEGCSV
jgi:DNA-binding transcriptional ArsR family regulator